MKFLIKRLSPYKIRMTVGLIIKITGTVAELLLPVILSHILDNVIKTESVPMVLLFGGLMILCALVALFGNIIANRMAAYVSMLFARDMRKELFSKTLYLSAKQRDDFTVASLESRITSDTYNVHHFILMIQRMGVRAPILLIGGMTISFIMDAYLSLVMLATFPLIFATVYLISRNGVPLYGKVQRAADGMVKVVREDTQGIRVIKALSKGEYENRRFDTVSRTLAKREKIAGTVMSIPNPIMTLLMNLGIAGVVALSATRIASGESSAATVIAFMQYFTTISMAMMALSRMFVMFTKCAASAKRINEVVESPDTFFITEECEKKNDDHIMFCKVSFSYLGKKNNLEDISFSLRRGGSLGVIGATGSGKTTLIKLLMRFYDTDKGEILIDGLPITSYRREELTGMFGSAMQSDFLYSESIYENIDFGRNLGREAIERAARIAQAHDFISACEGGYEYKLSPKGTNLSGGQRQRLLIARAIAADPDVLILDDSSSALDYKTDAALRSALASEMKDTTVITVAQRVSSVKGCDLILVLEDGKIIGSGKHEELLHSCSEYKEIADSQMGGAFLE